MRREIVLLCPCCQTTRRVSVNVTTYESENKDTDRKPFKPSVSIYGHCPNCNVKMYQADEELVNALKMLNDAGYETAFHCSAAHFDENCDVHQDDIEYPFERMRFTRGPHIIIERMTEAQIDALMAMGKQYKEGYTEDTKLQIEIERQVTKTDKLLGKSRIERDRIELMVMSADVNIESMKEACCILTEFIRKWLMSTNDGELPTGRGGHLSKIANTCWFS